jgi:hypothetical protein
MPKLRSRSFACGCLLHAWPAAALPALRKQLTAVPEWAHVAQHTGPFYPHRPRKHHTSPHAHATNRPTHLDAKHHAPSHHALTMPHTIADTYIQRYTYTYTTPSAHSCRCWFGSFTIVFLQIRRPHQICRGGPLGSAAQLTARTVSWRPCPAHSLRHHTSAGANAGPRHQAHNILRGQLPHDQPSYVVEFAIPAGALDGAPPRR